jgi:hypothetical protein
METPELCAIYLRMSTSQIVDQTDEYHTHTYGAAETLRLAREGVHPETEETPVRSQYPPHNPCLGFDWLDTREAARFLGCRETRRALNAELWANGHTPPRPEPNTRADWWATRGVEKFGAEFALPIARQHQQEQDDEAAQRQHWQQVIDNHQHQRQQQ